MCIDDGTAVEELDGEWLDDVCGVDLTTIARGSDLFSDVNDDIDVLLDDIGAWVDAVNSAGKEIIGSRSIDVVVGIISSWFRVYLVESDIESTKM